MVCSFRSRVLAGLVVGSAFFLALGPARAAEDSGKNVIYIGWDGAQRDHVKELLAAGELPVLAALAKEGTMVDIDVVIGATDTKAGWSQIATGYAPEKSGVYSNGRYQPIPEGYSIFERVEKALGPDKVDTLAVIGKKGHVDGDPPQRVPYEQFEKRQERQKKVDAAKPGLGNLVPGGKVVEEDGKKFIETPGKPWYITRQHMDLWVNGLSENEKVGTMALDELEKRKGHRFLFFVHFAEPDHAGHKHGENSQEYSDALKLDDLWTGKIIAKLKELGVYENTLVYVVVDHGFNEGQSGHSYAPWVFLATNDKAVNRDGAREDIAPTILKRFGIDLAKLDPPLDGIALDEPAPERKAPAEKAGQPKKESSDKPRARKAKANAGG
jgi:hypothetical protein